MSSNRPNLMLDEQSFQGLLAAAFTIQEHNDRIRQNRETASESAARSTTEATGTCPRCGAPKPAEAQRCQICSLDDFRPGERLQHNWASMWMMGQKQGLWPDHPPQVGKTTAEVGQAASRIREDTEQLVSRAAERESLTDSAHDLVQDLVYDPTLAIASAEAHLTTTPTEDLSGEDLPPEDSGLASRTFPFSARSDSFPMDRTLVGTISGTTVLQASGAKGSGTGLTMRALAEFRGQLRQHRADLYLGAAVVVAALALLWPTTDSPRRAALRPWERALVTLGIAEAPAPATHFRGDAGIEVWVDPHTALYYCPGEEQYGKTAGGRVSSQRDAQMDRFKPAGRKACE
jgi:ribosomal protein L40E